MTLEQLLMKEDDGVLLDIQHELHTAVIPATGYAHAYCRKVNKMIDAGDLCINPTTYRKVYLPTLSRAVQKELARRWTNVMMNEKVVSMTKSRENTLSAVLFAIVQHRMPDASHHRVQAIIDHMRDPIDDLIDEAIEEANEEV